MAKHAKNKFSIKSTDYSLLEDCKLDSDVFRTLAKIKQQNDPFGNNANSKSSKKTKIGGRTTNNSSNGYKIDLTRLDGQYDLEKTLKDINRGSNSKHKKNDLEAPTKQPSMQYFQFFDKDSLIPLFEKERAWYKKYKNVEQDEIPEQDYERYGLTEYEYKLKQKLLSQGFADWNYKHMWGFMKSCIDNGRENIDKICEALPSKTRDEIMRYSHAFFSNKYNDKDIEKKLKQIIDGEDIIERYSKYNDLMRQKIAKYEYPLQEMEFPTAPYDSRAHGWRIEHDRFIVLKLAEYGYGNWNPVRLAFLNDDRFRFDYFVRSRTALDINKRMRQIRPSIEKEFGQHIRIFDRKRTKQEIEARKQYEKDRLHNHLENMSTAFHKNNNANDHEDEKEESMSPSPSPLNGKRNASEMDENEDDNDDVQQSNKRRRISNEQQSPTLRLPSIPQQQPQIHQQQMHYSFMPQPHGLFPFHPPPENMVYYQHPPNAQFHTQSVYQMSYQTQSMMTAHPNTANRREQRTNP